MKKRFKLFSTIASLCLAIALMAFGVYAATSSTLTVSSTVTFVSTDIEVIWEWEVTGGNATTEDPHVGTYSTRDDIATGNTGTNQGAAANYTADIGEIKFNPVDEDEITYIFTCTNDANGEVTVTPSFAAKFTEAEENPNVEVTYYVNGAVAEWDIRHLTAKGTEGDSVEYKVVLKLLDCTMNSDLTGNALTGSFGATKKAAASN